ncbi:hypothetical protein [Paraburkholderia lacunae]|nr:hypothetical protein [Paraburkholderia lacunae]
MHALLAFASAVMSIGTVVAIQFPRRRNPWHKVGVAMLCLNISGI